VESPKYQYKLNWLSHLKEYLKKALETYPKLVLLGDFNIAPKDEDVYEPDLWRDKVLFSDP
jgi:exodeoxyribonuclease-3